MNNLQTDNLIALSLLIDEEIYVFNDEKKLIEKPETEIITAKTTEAKQPINIPKITAETPLPTKNNIHFDYLGENNKYILIIVNNPEVPFINKPDLDFLVKIMSAKKWTLEDVAIVNMAKYNNLEFSDLKAFFACNKIVTFGFNPAVLNIIGAVANQKLLFNGVTVLGTWDLAKLQKDVPKKTIFWNQLKLI